MKSAVNSNFEGITTRAANSIDFFSSSAYFSKLEFKFEFSNLIFLSLSSAKISSFSSSSSGCQKYCLLLDLIALFFHLYCFSRSPRHMNAISIYVA